MCKMFYILAKAVNVSVRFYSKPTKGKRSCAIVHPQQNVKHIEDLPSSWTQELLNILKLNSPTGAKKSLLLAPGLF